MAHLGLRKSGRGTTSVEIVLAVKRLVGDRGVYTSPSNTYMLLKGRNLTKSTPCLVNTIKEISMEFLMRRDETSKKKW